MGERRKVVSVERVQRSRAQVVNGRIVSATLSWPYVLTLDCGHKVERPNPQMSAKCPKGCASPKEVARG